MRPASTTDTITSQTFFRRYARVIRHFAATRAFEVIALQASPFLGGILGGFSFERIGIIRLGLLLLGSVALTSHVFVFNDWAGHISDSYAPRRATLLFTRRGIISRQVAHLAIALLIIASIIFAFVGMSAILIGAGIAALSLLYSYSPSFGKNTPIAASLNHLLGGALQFLLGYTLFHAVDTAGFAFSLFFGLVFAAGHLNQEVRDYEGDLLSGIRTSAVVFGCQRTFIASLFLFTVAYALIVGLVVFDILPKLLLLSLGLWFLQVVWSLQALRRGLGFEAAIWMQRRYHLLFALIGLMMLVK